METVNTVREVANHYRDERDKLQAEVDSLRAINADLLAALDEIVERNCANAGEVIQISIIKRIATAAIRKARKAE